MITNPAHPMKNYQQTPKQRRVKLAKIKTAMANTRKPGVVLQPHDGKRRIGGAPMEQIETIQRQHQPF